MRVTESVRILWKCLGTGVTAQVGQRMSELSHELSGSSIFTTGSHWLLCSTRMHTEEEEGRHSTGVKRHQYLFSM